MPQAGCRTISLTFNRLHAAKSKQPISIGKTYVAEVLKRSQMEVRQARDNGTLASSVMDPLNFDELLCYFVK